ncbi:MAG: VWA domain-containing protein, partial [Desulfobacteraceae bacterium]|nr:VWA domain-containing protein [Desulfobacteraceae bacterium]
LYAANEQPLEQPAEGTDVFVDFHGRISELPEVKDLRERCVGEERWAGIGAASIVDTLLADVEAPSSPVEDMRGDVDVREALEAMMGGADTDEQKEAIREILKENAGELQGKADASAAASNMMDDTQIRNSVRKAVQLANERIDQEQKMMDSFGVDAGTGAHSGRTARRNLSKKLSTLCANNERLREIAELAGRLKRIAMEQQRQKPRKGTDEVAGIELGADLRKVIPPQFLFADEEVEGIFAAKLYEHSLVQIEMSKQPKKEQGPIVVLQDSSGSMRGNCADTWAAAVSLAFLKIAHKQKRPFAIIHFGASVLRTDVFGTWSEFNHDKLMESVSYFAADGGTNFEPPLREAVSIIRNTGAFIDADIVMLTDGRARVDGDFMCDWKKDKSELGFNCYSILIGDYTSVETNKMFSDDVVHLKDVLSDDEAMHKFFKEV